MHSRHLDTIARTEPAAIAHRQVLRLLIAAGAGGLTAGVVAAGMSAAAPVAKPWALPPAVVDWIAGWEATDPARLALAYAEDAVSESVAFGTSLRNRDEIQDFFTNLFDAFEEPVATIPHVPRFHAMGGPRGITVMHDHVAVPWQFQGRYTGQLPGMPEGRGQMVSAWGFDVMTLRDERIVEEHIDIRSSHPSGGHVGRLARYLGRYLPEPNRRSETTAIASTVTGPRRDTDGMVPGGGETPRRHGQRPG